MVARTLLLLTIAGYACAATWQGFMPPKPMELAHKEGCYIHEVNDVIPYGESVSPLGICYTIECTKRMIYYASCGKFALEDKDNNCFLTEEDTSRPYPECCPDIKCIDDNQL